MDAFLFDEVCRTNQCAEDTSTEKPHVVLSRFTTGPRYFLPCRSKALAHPHEAGVAIAHEHRSLLGGPVHSYAPFEQ